MSNESNPVNPPAKPVSRKRKTSMERVMIMFTLFFIIGILLLTLVPEEHAARGAVMGIYSIAVCWAMYRFGV